MTFLYLRMIKDEFQIISSPSAGKIEQGQAHGNLRQLKVASVAGVR